MLGALSRTIRTTGAIGFLAAAVVVTTLIAAPSAQSSERAVDRAFAAYDRIYAALARDSMDGVAAAAAILQPLAREIAGEAAERAAATLAAATTLDEARLQFAALGEPLVPKFLEAKIPGLKGFVCTMKKAKWVQKGDAVANPYFGRSMPTCGVPIKAGG